MKKKLNCNIHHTKTLFVSHMLTGDKVIIKIINMN